MAGRLFQTCILAVSFCLASVTWAQACLGVSRTINIRSFQPFLGASPSGGIGLRHKEVVLTFDDGPMAGSTQKVLSALSANCTKATFFVVGDMARANPKLLQTVARAGHTIAHHTQNHRNLTTLSQAAAERSIASGVASVKKALGPYSSRSTKLFRYPYLARSAALDNVLKRQGLLPLSAAVMSQDWKAGSGAAMVDRVMRHLDRTGRGIILLHDIQYKTAGALPELLNRLKRGGYKVVHLRSGSSPRFPTALASAEPKKRYRTARASTHETDEPQRERSWSLFGRRDSDAFDGTTTGSVKRTKRKTVSRASLKAKPTTTAMAREPAENKKAAPSSLKSWLAKRREQAGERKSAALETKRNEKLRRRGTRKSEKNSTGSETKRKSIFFRNRMTRREGESAASYHARLRARRLRLNKTATLKLD